MTLQPKVWFAFYTLPKHEKKVYNFLQGQNYQAYLPTQSVVKQWSDRKKKMVVPLFPNYIFVYSDPSKLYYILRASGIVRVLTEGRKPAMIPEEEIGRIRIMTNGETEMEVRCSNEKLTLGASVKVVGGPLKGITGFLVQNKGNQRLLVELKTLHKIMQVDVPAAFLQKV